MCCHNIKIVPEAALGSEYVKEHVIFPAGKGILFLKYFLCGKVKPFSSNDQLQFGGISLTSIWANIFSFLVLQVVLFIQLHNLLPSFNGTCTCFFKIQQVFFVVI